MSPKASLRPLTEESLLMTALITDSFRALLSPKWQSLQPLSWL